MTAEEYIKDNWGEKWLSVDWTAGDVVDALEEFAKMQLAGQSKMPSEDIDVAEMHMNDSVFKQNVNDAIAEKMPSEEEWIDIKDRMPESGQCVLIYSHSGGVAEGAWLSSKNHFEQWRWSAVLNDVTHWFIDVFLNNSEKYHNKIDKK